MQLGEIIKSMDWVLNGAAILLVVISLAMLFSATQSIDLATSRFVRQAFAFVIALAVGVLVARFPYHSINRYAMVLYAIGVLGLLTVLVSGQIIRGTTSRLEFYGFQLQPSEFMKIVLVVALAWLMAQGKHLTNSKILLSGALMALPVSLIILEPDLGVAALLIFVWIAILVFNGLPWLWVSVIGIFGAGGFMAAWRWLLADYQKDRLSIFIDSGQDPLGAGYNIVQSIVAMGSGRLFGRGLGHGPQSQLNFLPESETDFILSSVGEELGFIGIGIVLALYVILLLRILKIARSTEDSFGQYIAVGIFSILLVSFVVAAGMNMGLLPVTGIPLPLLSYGGSNLLSTFVLLGLVQSIRVYSKWDQSPPIEISDFT